MEINPKENLLDILRTNLNQILEDLKSPHPKNIETALTWYAQCMQCQITTIETFQINKETEDATWI